MTITQIAKQILNEYKIPLSQSEIYNIAEKRDWISKTNLKGKTPWATFGARLYEDAKSENGTFATIGTNPKNFI